MSGLDLRPLDPQDPADLEWAWRIVRDGDIAVAGESDETRDGTRATCMAPGVVRALIGERAGVPEALLVVDVDPHAREVFVDTYARGEDRPAWFRRLLPAALEIAAQRAAAEPAAVTDPYVVAPEVWQAVAAHYSEDASYAAVLGEFGFRPARRFWRMHRPVGPDESTRPGAPSGVSLRSSAGEQDERLVHALAEESFAEHFGFAPTPFAEWMDQLRASAGVDPSRWWIAEADGVPAGICLLDDSHAESGDAYVRTLGVVPSARGRGIARWLLACAIADAAWRGRTGIALSVDGENTTGATALYESVGFRPRRVIDVAVRPG